MLFKEIISKAVLVVLVLSMITTVVWLRKLGVYGSPDYRIICAKQIKLFSLLSISLLITLIIINALL